LTQINAQFGNGGQIVWANRALEEPHDVSPPIVTLTLNPAVDLGCVAESVLPSHKIRTFEEQYDPGGGGINVARVLHFLGSKALALIMTGGVTGRLLEELLDEEGVAWKALPIRGRNRISLNVHDRKSGLEYRFVPAGPHIDTNEWETALQVLEEVEAEWIVASGSLPPGVPADFYARAIAIATRRGQKFVLDTSGSALGAVKGHGMELLKLSLRELEFLTGHEHSGAASRADDVAHLIQSGTARKIAVTLGPDGALLGTKDGIIHRPAVKVEQRGAAGAGDSFLAGLVLGLAEGRPDQQALAFGNAAGAAAVASYGTARIQRADVEALDRD
jgi:6-phosphofructokinase 2